MIEPDTDTEKESLCGLLSARDEDPWEYNFALGKGLVPHSVQGVWVLARVESPANDHPE